MLTLLCLRSFVFSTCVEVFLYRMSATIYDESFLHVRGGVSRIKKPMGNRRGVFSTCVEVFLLTMPMILLLAGFLHVRGGVSSLSRNNIQGGKFSPRAWRCFSPPEAWRRKRGVFSTCVEVFLIYYLLSISLGRFLHVRGGVSASISASPREVAFSPRAWRCFAITRKMQRKLAVFPTCVYLLILQTRFFGCLTLAFRLCNHQTVIQE